MLISDLSYLQSADLNVAGGFYFPSVYISQKNNNETYQYSKAYAKSYKEAEAKSYNVNGTYQSNSISF